MYNMLNRMNPGMMKDQQMMIMNPNMMPTNLNKLGSNPMNIGGAQVNQEAEEIWKQGFNLGIKEVLNEGKNSQIQKINITFKTTQGTAHLIRMDYGTTINEALKIYLKRVGRPDLIYNITNKICFLYNANRLNFGDKTPIEKYFNYKENPMVIVNDVNNVIGA